MKCCETTWHVPPTVICKDIDMESLESLIVSPLTFSRTWDEMGCETELSIAQLAQLAQLPLPQHASTVCHPMGTLHPIKDVEELNHRSLSQRPRLEQLIKSYSSCTPVLW